MGAALNTMGKPFDSARCLQAAVTNAERRAVLQPGDAAQRTIALAKVRLAETLQETGDLRGALPVVLEAASAVDDLALRHPASAVYKRDSMIAHLTLGHVLGSPLYLNLERVAESEQHYRRAVALAEELANVDLQNADARRNLSQAYTRLAAAIRDQDPAQSVELYRKGAALTDELVRSDPANVFLLRMRAYDLAAVAWPLRKLGQRSAAQRSLDEALKIQEAQHARDPLETEFLHDIPLTRLAMGDVAADAGPATVALAQYARAIELGEEIRKRYPDDLSCHAVLADVYMQLGRLHAARGDLGEAAPWYRKSLEIWESWARRGVQFPSMQTRVAQAQALLAKSQARDR
jgi:tetratricopeptide (TPR) repeat protein